MLPSAFGEKDMASGRPQTAKVIAMVSTQSLSTRLSQTPHSTVFGLYTTWAMAKRQSAFPVCWQRRQHFSHIYVAYSYTYLVIGEPGLANTSRYQFKSQINKIILKRLIRGKVLVNKVRIRDTQREVEAERCSQQSNRKEETYSGLK